MEHYTVEWTIGHWRKVKIPGIKRRWEHSVAVFNVYSYMCSNEKNQRDLKYLTNDACQSSSKPKGQAQTQYTAINKKN